jgi:hypothetical protein
MPRVVKTNKEKVMNFNYERTENGMNVGKGILAKKVLTWAEANYDSGGHWIFDRMEADVIEYTFTTLEEAQEYCQLLNGLNKEVNSW